MLGGILLENDAMNVVLEVLSAEGHFEGSALLPAGGVCVADMGVVFLTLCGGGDDKRGEQQTQQVGSHALPFPGELRGVVAP